MEAIGITGKKVKAMRIGDLEEVKNKNAHHWAAKELNHLRVEFSNGTDKHLLLTDYQVERAIDRAMKNPEDLPNKSWLWDVMEFEIIDPQRKADVQEVVNKNKLPAAATKYNHILNFF